MSDQADPKSVRGDVRAEIQEFLTTRRSRITPDQAGLQVYAADRRRVTGLKRDEVALLAGISSQYYTKLERGHAAGVSASVIDALVKALQLDDAERTHLEDLVRAAGTTAPRRRPAAKSVRPTIQRVLDSMVNTPAVALNARLDIVTANPLGYALFAPMLADPARPTNNARFVFLDPKAGEFFREWNKVADDTIAILHAEAGRHPYDRKLSDLIGELSTRSDPFRTRWAAHNVQIHNTGTKLIHHPVVGDLDLPFESFPLAADLSQTLITYTPEPGSPTHDGIVLLASYATVNQQESPLGSEQR